MKRRPTENERSAENLAFLATALASLRTVEEVQAFLEDLCTPAELEAMGDRWRVVPLLQENVPYREIHERTQVSVTTIGRVARTLERGAGGYGIAASRLSTPPAAVNAG
ncbi:YerC/YecD family TrpR-related protein [Lysobacter changpingensis]|jgi:TrpR-related protein YerC/YecD|uniref:YerC/YecD family TrpR-related protein n=1 Tax=Lysobacter changpingensis TaxID=2792784 RepID=UPI001A8DEC33|nr:YerC/YecD family TrpR-related protein [Lysobacter changpingensis]